MADRPSFRRSPRHHPASDNIRAAEDGPGYFAPHSSPAWSQIKVLEKYLRKRELVPKDQELGTVYVAKQARTGFCKVGFAQGNAKQRLDAINRCAIDRESSYSTPPHVCAWRAEQILHKLLYHTGHARQRCSCRKRNREWFQHNYQDTIRLVQTVYSWLQQQPYDMETKKLKPVWEAALRAWMKTQEGEQPLGWNDFFLIGPGKPVLEGGCYTTMPHHEPVRQDSLTRRVTEVVKKLFRKDLAQNQTQRVEVLSGDQDVYQSPISTSLEMRSQSRIQQPGLKDCEHWIAAVDDVERIAIRSPQLGFCEQQEFDVEKITARMPGAFPADEIEQASFIIPDVCETPGSSCVQAELATSQDPNENEFPHDAHGPEASVSQPDRDRENLGSDVLPTTDQLPLQEATASLIQTSSTPVVQSTKSTIQAREEMTADSSFSTQTAPAQSPVGSPHSETTQEACIAAASEPVYDKAISDEASLARRLPSETENDDQSSKVEFDNESEQHAEIESHPMSNLEDVQRYDPASALTERKILIPKSRQRKVPEAIPQANTTEERASFQDPRAHHGPSEDNKDFRWENVSTFGEDEDSRAVQESSDADADADADDEESSNEDVTSPSKDQDRYVGQDFRNEDVSSSSENEYTSSSKGSDCTEPEQYERATGSHISKNARTVFVSQISRLGAAYRVVGS